MSCEHKTSEVILETMDYTIEQCTWDCQDIFVLVRTDFWYSRRTAKISQPTPPGLGWLVTWRNEGAINKALIPYNAIEPPFELCAVPIGYGSKNRRPAGGRCNYKATKDGKCVRHYGYKAAEWEFCQHCQNYKQVGLPCVMCKK